MRMCSSKSSEFSQKQLEDYVFYDEVVDEQIAAIASLLNTQDVPIGSVSAECEQDQTARSGF